jgi:hypothetical protein
MSDWMGFWGCWKKMGEATNKEHGRNEVAEVERQSVCVFSVSLTS